MKVKKERNNSMVLFYHICLRLFMVDFLKKKKKIIHGSIIKINPHIIN